MNRKLRDTLIALSASGLLLIVGLLAGNPQPIHAPLASQAPPAAQTGDDYRPGTLRRRASSHRKFALPYFSFAQGARGRGG